MSKTRLVATKNILAVYAHIEGLGVYATFFLRNFQPYFVTKLPHLIRVKQIVYPIKLHIQFARKFINGEIPNTKWISTQITASAQHTHIFNGYIQRYGRYTELCAHFIRSALKNKERHQRNSWKFTPLKRSISPAAERSPASLCMCVCASLSDSCACLLLLLLLMIFSLLFSRSFAIVGDFCA